MKHRWRAAAALFIAATACGTDNGCPEGQCENNGTANNGQVDPNDRDGDGVPNDEEARLGTDPDAADTDGDGRLDGTEVALGTDPTRPEEICATEAYRTDRRTRPVDVIFVIDNSGSMREEIESVETNINENFAQIMADQSLDYRLIVVGKHGEGGPFDSDICVASPLSGSSCDPVPDAPANTDRFFHYDVEVTSDNAVAILLDTYARPDRHGFTNSGWSAWLRPDAYKNIIAITDDESLAGIPGGDPNAQNFENVILTYDPPQFGVAGSRNYVFHSIVGVGKKADGSVYQPAEPIPQTQCGTAESKGIEYQKLSVVSGGVRYPVCEFDSYDAVFRTVANGIVDDTQIDCSLRLPGLGENVTLDRLALQYTGDGGRARVITQVKNAAECGEDNFYLTTTSIELCPAFCEEIEGGAAGSLDVFAQCNERLCDNPSIEICGDDIDNDCDGFVDRFDIECLL